MRAAHVTSLQTAQFRPVARILAAVACLGLALTGPASAQVAASAEGADGAAKSVAEIEQVVVTGSHIRSTATKLESISPITSTGIEEIRTTGAINVEAVLRDLPEAFPGRGATTNNNGNGDTSANLRNLGPQRTLVLIDGKRSVSSDSKGNVDLDIIPTGMIDRVDVVTGGASAVYGADAVAGVVNILLKKNFKGFQADAQYGAYNPGDGRNFDSSLLAGADFANGQGNLTAFAGFTQRDPVYRRDRDWASPQLVSDGTSLVPFGSGTIPAGRVTTTGTMFNENRELVPYDNSVYDSSRSQYLVVPQQRISLGLIGHYDAAPWASVYFRSTYSENKVDRQVSDGAGFLDTVSVNYGNPLLSNQERSVLFGNGAFGPDDTTDFTLRKSILANGNIGEHNVYDTLQFISGLTGALGSHFSYDVSTQYGQTRWQQVLVGDISPERFRQGLLVNPDGTCIDPSNGCVPIDIFTAAGGAITPEQVRFFQLTQRAGSTTTQVVTTGSVFGDLGGLGVKSPLAESAVGVALGGEYRRETSNYTPDDVLSVGDNVVYGSIPALSGTYHVSEVFLEARIPLVEDKPWIESLELEGGYRNSHYNLAGRANTYKYGGSWRPVRDIRFRGAFERAVRAPNIGELFTAAQPQSANGVDPCFSNGASGPTASASLCQSTGVSAAAYGDVNLQCPSGTCRVFTGGNPLLGLEVSDSKTVGLALTPRFTPGLSLSLDYYDIKVKGAISTLGTDAQPILDGCYGTGVGENPTQDPNNIFCQSIRRSAAGDLYTGGHNGSVGYISLLNENIGFIRISGIDYAVDYVGSFSDLGMRSVPGTFSVSSKAAYVGSYTTQANETLPEHHCAGTYGLTCGQPVPHWRASTRLTWAPIPSLPLSLRWRYVGNVVLDEDRISGTVTDPPDHEIGARSYFDFSGSWQIDAHFGARIGINNLFDKSPPQVSRNIASAFIFGFANTFPGTYDIGRQFFAGATYQF